MRLLLTPLVLSLVVGCASSSEPPAATPAPAPAPSPEPLATAPAPAPAPEPTAEEKKKAEEAKKLEADWAKMLEKNAAETARITPEVRDSAKTLASRTYPSTRAALKAALSGKHRSAGAAERDAQRHPIETLEFFGLKPTHSVLEYGPGEGWYTELLAPALASKGKLSVTMADPNGPKTERATLYGERTKLFLERLPEAYGKVDRVIVDGKAPKLGADATYDLVLLFRGAHGMYNNKTLGAWLSEFHRVLKPGGALGIEQHRAAPDKKPEETSKQGYLSEPWLIAQVEAAGFKLSAKSEINANPKDTKDHPEGVWALPPTLRLGEVDKAKYVAIGESDRMTLRFVKADVKGTAAKSAAAQPGAAAPAAAPAPAAKPAMK
jgi:predicted methyltransferase